MHELSLCEGIVRIAEREAAARQSPRVRLVKVEVGRLSSVEPEALRFAFPSAALGTVVEGAALEIVMIDGSAWCLDCETDVVIGHRTDPCPACHGFRLMVTGGTDMRVVELEID